MGGRILDCEWTILRALWGDEKLSMGEIIANVQKTESDIQWNYKTYHSYLRTMLEKGLIGCDVLSAREKLYYPIITREETLKRESDSLFSRVSHDAVGRLVAMMAKQGQISQQDRRELMELFASLDKKDGE